MSEERSNSLVHVVTLVTRVISTISHTRQVGGTLDQAPSNANTSEQNPGIFRLIFGLFGFPFGFTVRLAPS